MGYVRHLKIKSWSEEDQPREKFAQKGKRSLSDAELIAILIGSGNRDESAVELSKRILKGVNNNLNELGKLSLENLMNYHGIGEAKAVSIAAALELGRRRMQANLVDKVVINSSQTAYEVIGDKLLDLSYEEFWIILLNTSNQVIACKNISKGGVSGTVADAKLIFKAALDKLASAIILCHNHPSGNVGPSQQDRMLTKKLIEGGKQLDIEVLDHLIIGNNQYYSFADQGII